MKIRVELKNKIRVELKIGGKPMQIQTALFGAIQIEKTDIIHFPEAIPGFPEEKEFV